MNILFLESIKKFGTHHKFIEGLQKEIDDCGDGIELTWLAQDLERRYQYTWYMVKFPDGDRACSIYEGIKSSIDDPKNLFTKDLFNGMQFKFCKILNLVIGVLSGEISVSDCNCIG